MSVELTFDNAVATLLLNRPKSKNAITLQMWQAAISALTEVSASEATCLIVRGADHCFSSGVDLGELGELDSLSEAQNYWGKIKEALSLLANLKIPSIASIEGYCLGGGLLLALACDLRYASNTSQFSLPIAKLGLILDRQNLARLVNLVGHSNTKMMIFTGDIISGVQALHMGLLNEIADPSQLADLVRERAKSIGENDAKAIMHSKEQIDALNPPPESGVYDQTRGEDRLIAKSFVAANLHKKNKASGP